MTQISILSFEPPAPSTRDLMDRALDPYVLIGMPHLTPSGLSETWLMKELGHRHWLMLASHLHMPDADFRTPDGAEAYAAICATSLKAAQFGKIRANAVLTIRSDLAPVSRTQISTRHRLFVHGMAAGAVELVSTFVSRAAPDDNHSIARVTVPGVQPLPGLVPLRGLAPAAAAGENGLADTASRFRNHRLDRHFDLATTGQTPLRSFRFEPARLQEFNGAGLFYFAEFQAVVERAFADWFPETSTTHSVERREVFFSGNIRPGEILAIELMDMSPDRLSSFCRLRRADGKVIARVFTQRVACENS